MSEGERAFIGKDGWKSVVKPKASGPRVAAREIIDRDGWQTVLAPKVLEEFRSELTSSPEDLRMPPMPDPSFGRAVGAPQGVLTSPVRRPMLPVAVPVLNMPASGNVPDMPLLRIPRAMFVREEKVASDPLDTSRQVNVIYKATCARGTYDVDLTIKPPGALLYEYVARHLGEMDVGEVFADGLRLDGSAQDGVHAALNKVTRLMVEVPDELQAGPGILDLPLVGTISSYPTWSRYSPQGAAGAYLGRIPQVHTPAAAINETKKFGQGVSGIRFAYQRDISTSWTVGGASTSRIREKRPRFPPLLVVDYHQTWTGYVKIDPRNNALIAQRTSIATQTVII